MSNPVSHRLPHRLSHGGLIAALAVAPGGGALADTIFVDGSCGNDAWTGALSVCLEPDGPKATITAAITTAAPGDVIVVAAGVYGELVDFSGKAITLRSADGPAVTTIDGGGLGTVVTCDDGEGPDTVLTGFTITGGDAASGGGMRCDGSSPVITDCTFSGNSANDGGGMRNFESSPTLTDCTFTGNAAVDDGGAICNEDSRPTITGCTFNANTAISQGGGIFNVASSPTVTSCTFSGNMAGWGGGMANESDCSPAITSCVFSGNTAASSGGGLRNFNTCSPDVTSCRFLGNSAGTVGGGMANFSDSDPAVTNCTFSGNTAGGAGAGMYGFFISDPAVTNCTFSANSAGTDGGGMASLGDSNPVLTNCILWGDTPDEISTNSAPIVSYCDVQGGWSGAGTDNIDADPRFVDADGLDDVVGTGDDDLRLFGGSPVVDAADSAAVPPGVTTDLDGRPRILDGDLDGEPIVDMGAYEVEFETSGAVLNVTQSTIFDTIPGAIAAAVNGDELLAGAFAFQRDTDVDYHGKALTLRSTADLDQPESGRIRLAGDAHLAVAKGGFVTLLGELVLPPGDVASVQAAAMSSTATGSLVASATSILEIIADGGASLAGTTRIDPAATMTFSGGVSSRGAISVLEGGALSADGNLDNFGSILLLGGGSKFGTLTITGTLTNNGTIIGDMSDGSPPDPGRGKGPAGSGGGLAVSGDLVSGAATSLLMPDPGWRVALGGQYEVAIDGNQRYDMAVAELRMAGTGDGVQTLEVMSEDIGPDPRGRDRREPGHFPIGTLRIGPSPTTVSMVDLHDNDGLGQSVCEAIYVHELIVDAGATLNTNGCRVYHVTARIDGAVDDPANLVPIEDLACPADLDESGAVDFADVLVALMSWGPCPPEGDCPADLDASGAVDFADVVVVLVAWGACP